uniref:ATP synthase complex subunit 8 n=1 Tax=Eurycea cirrigera TaxID=332575 RepID=A0A343ERB8_9SALA|nr:ATP synthase F0 subunit 8 [Eurycea cirrigera]ASK85746.1 ATP synthase F0 subunit 8 [Eurycea cirrigera]ASS30848.1 ATP synthase F0 subunit 8 [Eurycea cirrigera]
MPQLNPNPWFSIFFMSWLVYLVIVLLKTNNLKMFNEPTQDIIKNKPQPWYWPWT